MHESTSPKGVDIIEIRRTGEGDLLEFEVVVREGKGETRHHVTMARETCKRLTAGKHTPERCLEAALRFLLDREPKESILSRFDVTVISHDFPEFEQELPSYLLRPLIWARELHRSIYIWFLLRKTTVCRLLPFRRLAPGIVEAIPPSEPVKFRPAVLSQLQ